MNIRIARPWLFVSILAGVATVLIGDFDERRLESQPYDVSGLAWLGADSFLVVHDAKYPDEATRKRVGIIKLPDSSSRVAYSPLEVVWPEGATPSHDLESVSRIPGSRYFLLAESGDDGRHPQRLYLSIVDEGQLAVRDVVNWPVRVENVEGIAVATLEDASILLFAERAHGHTATELRWTTIDPDSLSFGAVENVIFESPAAIDPDFRPISSLEVDQSGRIYAASSYDPERELGPFRSIVWEIGRVQQHDDRLAVILSRAPRRIATLDGLKVEGLAVRERRGESIELFVGTDDEAYGAIIRPLPLEAPED